MSDAAYELRPIGWVESSLVEPDLAPRQGDEGAPDAWLVLTWLHRARRDVLSTHPRDDLTRPECGIFSTRSADRPNPIGLHDVQIVTIEGLRIRVRNLEAVDGTPILDIKPRLEPIERR